jgi:hypothetical protein
MSNDVSSTRRTFLRSGVLLAAPVAAAAAPIAALAGDDPKARLTRLEEEAALRALHESWLRRVNAGERDAVLDDAVCRITADHTGTPDRIEIAADGRSAVGYFDYVVELQTPLAKESTLARMAHAQGHGSLRCTERRMLTVDYTKTGGSWEIAKVALKTL